MNHDLMLLDANLSLVLGILVGFCGGVTLAAVAVFIARRHETR